MSSPTFYVASTLGERTAGPEALTQFVDAIRRRGHRAFLIPMWNFRGRRNDPEYDIYDFEVAENIADPDNAIFVLSEISPIESFKQLRQIPRQRTWMGWFSVNNSPDPRARYFRPSEQTGSMFPPEYVGKPPPVGFGLERPAVGTSGVWRDAWQRTRDARHHYRAAAVEAISIRYARSVVDSPVQFFAQSYYAQGFCRDVLGRPAPVITDPLRVIPLPELPRRSNVIAYNKTKAWSLIPEIKERIPNAEFLPIGGMPYVEAMQALSTASVYVELGHLPGRDRLPREAAHLGTPVVMLARGSGYLWADSPLPVEDRIAFAPGWADEMATAIGRILDDVRAAQERQVPYRTWVAGERERYEQAIDNWLAMALTNEG
jgi:hypothetical protein